VRRWAIFLGFASLAGVAACGAVLGFEDDAPGAGDAQAGADGTSGSDGAPRGADGAPADGPSGDGGCGVAPIGHAELTKLSKVTGVVISGNSLLVAHASGLTKCGTGPSAASACVTATFGEPVTALAAVSTGTVVVAHGGVIEECTPATLTGTGKDGCSEIFTSNSVIGTEALTLTGANRIHFATGGEIFRAASGGAMVLGSYTTGRASGVRLSPQGTRIFFTGPDTIGVLEDDGGVTTVAGATVAGVPEDVLVVGGYALVTTGPSLGKVLRCPSTGCTGAAEETLAAGRKHPHHLGMGGTYVYFTDLVEGSLARVPLAGTGPATVVTSCLVSPRHVAPVPSAFDVYVVVNGPADGSGTGDVVRIVAPP